MNNHYGVGRNLVYIDERDVPRIYDAIENLGVGDEVEVRLPVTDNRGLDFATSVESEFGPKVNVAVGKFDEDNGFKLRVRREAA